MPGTANTGWFGGGATTGDAYRRSPTSTGGGGGNTHTSSGKISDIFRLFDFIEYHFFS